MTTAARPSSLPSLIPVLPVLLAPPACVCLFGRHGLEKGSTLVDLVAIGLERPKVASSVLVDLKTEVRGRTQWTQAGRKEAGVVVMAGWLWWVMTGGEAAGLPRAGGRRRDRRVVRTYLPTTADTASHRPHLLLDTCRPESTYQHPLLHG